MVIDWTGSLNLQHTQKADGIYAPLKKLLTDYVLLNSSNKWPQGQPPGTKLRLSDRSLTKLEAILRCTNRLWLHAQNWYVHVPPRTLFCLRFRLLSHTWLSLLLGRDVAGLKTGFPRIKVTVYYLMISN